AFEPIPFGEKGVSAETPIRPSGGGFCAPMSCRPCWSSARTPGDDAGGWSPSAGSSSATVQAAARTTAACRRKLRANPSDIGAVQAGSGRSRNLDTPFVHALEVIAPDFPVSEVILVVR